MVPGNNPSKKRRSSGSTTPAYSPTFEAVSQNGILEQGVPLPKRPLLQSLIP